MPKNDVDQERVRVSVLPPEDSSLKKIDDVFIIVTQAFCPNGHNLVADANEQFDDYPGIKLSVGKDDEWSEVTLSPFHGDASKKSTRTWKQGTKLEIKCPTCQTALPRLASCKCEGTGEGDMVTLFLTPDLKDSNILAMCNVWGCRRSRTVNNHEIISEYLDGQIED